MRVEIGQSFRKHTDESHYVDTTVYVRKWTTLISAGIWKEGEPSALASYDRRYLNYERVVPMKFAKVLAGLSIRSHERKLKRALNRNKGAE